MKHPATLLFGLIALGLACYAWNQFRQISELRRAILESAEEQGTLQQQAMNTRQRVNQLETELELARTAGLVAPSGASSAPAVEANAPGGRTAASPMIGGMMQNAVALLSNPEGQRLMAVQQRGHVDARYAALFRQLNLPADKLAQFKALLIEKQLVQSDVMVAAAQQGLNPMQNPREYRTLVANAQSDIETKIKDVLGPDHYDKFDFYNRTLPQRNVVNQLQQSLSYTSAPLAPNQAEQLVRILEQNPPVRPNVGPSMTTTNTMFFSNAAAGGIATAPMVMNVMTGGSVLITDEAVAQAQTVLLPPQLEALRDLQEQQRAQQQLAREMMQNGSGGFRTMMPADPTQAGGGAARTPAPAARPPGG